MKRKTDKCGPQQLLSSSTRYCKLAARTKELAAASASSGARILGILLWMVPCSSRKLKRGVSNHRGETCAVVFSCSLLNPT